MRGVADAYEVRVDGGRPRTVQIRSEDRRCAAMIVPVILDMVDQTPLIVEIRRPGEPHCDVFRVWTNRRGELRADNHAEPVRQRQATPGLR